MDQPRSTQRYTVAPNEEEQRLVEGDRIRFQPANANMDPIIVRKVDFKSVDIIGIVVGVYRRL